MIDFTFTEEQEIFRKKVAEFTEKKIKPKVREMEEKKVALPEVVEALKDEKLTGIFIPKEYNGLGLGYTERLIALEEIAKVSPGVAMMLQIFGLGIEPILKFGNDEQKQKYLPGLAVGEKLATVAVTEATGGSDPTGIKTTYKKEGDFYILNGRKIMLTNAPIANTFVVLAKDSENPKAFSTLIIEDTFEGFRRGKEWHEIGLHGCSVGEILLENCKVPASNLLGQEGKGMRVAMSAIGEVGRGGMVGVALGIMDTLLKITVNFSKKRILYGKPISNLQTIQNKIAEMRLDLEIGRLLGYRATSIQDKGQRSDLEFAMAKYFTTEAAQKAAKMAVDIQGGYGVTEEAVVTRFLRDSFVLGPSAGTSDIMKVIIARATIGK
ncbi:acyl-CoA dehydrogenase family protein [Hippea alviniae]|uniref:acyl-CoA dehydrogenase family protein n=1 Tax=Hippea alviniae TaxID=1279027 RepID=UPI0003B6170B|nr:acyl-CoA dehydrogenase family protein [Hippea alviniae]